MCQVIRDRIIEQSKARVSPPCPMCGASMVEQDRVREQGAVYIWYACSKAACGGQWLTQLMAPRARPEWPSQSRRLEVRPSQPSGSRPVRQVR